MICEVLNIHNIVDLKTNRFLVIFETITYKQL